MTYNPLSSSDAFTNEFRLTLTTAVPVTTANVTGATTLYCAPFVGNRIALFDGTATWQTYKSAEFSIALGTLTAALPYDVYCYASSGIPTLELLAWTNGTTRATALVMQDGVWSKTGALTRRYMGTFYTTSTTATADATSQRFLYNASNRVVRTMSAVGATAGSYTYTTATWRSVNSNTTVGEGRINYVSGLADDSVYMVGWGSTNNDTLAYTGHGIGIDSTSANSAIVYGSLADSSSGYNNSGCFYRGYPGVGFHFIQMLEISQAAGTTNWAGTSTANGYQNGLYGEILA